MDFFGGSEKKTWQLGGLGLRNLALVSLSPFFLSKNCHLPSCDLHLGVYDIA